MSIFDSPEDRAKALRNPVAIGGAAIGGTVGGPIGAAAGAEAGSKVDWDPHAWFGNKKADEASADFKDSIANQMSANQQTLQKEKQSGDTYYDRMQGAANNYMDDMVKEKDAYEKDVNKARSDVSSQATEAKANYTNNILPNLQDLMARSKDNAANAMSMKDFMAKSQAPMPGQMSMQDYANKANSPIAGQMSLQDYMNKSGAPIAGQMSLAQAEDPNNQVASSMRGMYGQQAQGIQNQGLADYGVLAGLGSQATANATGAGMPMTGSQIQLMQGANLGSATQAFSNAQNQANQLRLQGIGAGTNQSNLMYGLGQQAQQQQFQQAGEQFGQGQAAQQQKFQQAGEEFGVGQQAQQQRYNQMADTYGAGQQAQQSALGMTGAYEGAANRGINAQNAFTQQQLGFGRDTLGMESGLSGQRYNANQAMGGLRYGIDTSQAQNEMGVNNAYYGAQQSADTAQAQAGNAARAGMMGMGGTLLGAGIGAMAGGVPGAQLGATLGGAGGNAAAAQGATPVPMQSPQASVNGYNPGQYGGYGASPYGGGSMYGNQNPYARVS